MGRLESHGCSTLGRLYIGQCVRDLSQRLSDVFVLKFRVLTLQFSSIRICSQGFKYTTNSKAKVTNARLAVHSSNVRRDSIELSHSGCSPSRCCFAALQSLDASRTPSRRFAN